VQMFPHMRFKRVHETVPGELVIAEVKGRRVPAICAPFYGAQEGQLVFVLIYLAVDLGGVRGPYFDYADERLLCLGTEYAIVPDLLAPSRPPEYRGAPRLVISGAEQLLCVPSRENHFSLALNLDTGKTQPEPAYHLTFGFSRWELRLKRDGVIDSGMPPMFTWDPAAVAAGQKTTGSR
jgi:hypothetical protein